MKKYQSLSFPLFVIAFAIAMISTSAARAEGASTAGTPTAGVARLGVCLDDDNPPFSSHATFTGVDVDTARALAKVLKRELEFSWVTVPVRGGMGKALKESIQSGRCDVFMGLPIDDDTASDLASRKLAGSKPYLTLGYILVSPPGTTPLTMDKARKAKRFGAVTATPADLFLHKEKFNRVPYGNNRELMQALQSAEIDAALIWSPAYGGLRSPDTSKQPVVAAEQATDPILRTNLALAIRTADPVLASAVDAALEQLRAEGSIRNFAQAQGLPWLTP